jgi:hypothetical protein
MKTWNSHCATKFALLWTVGCWGLTGALQVNAADFTYDINVDNGFLVGAITTSCDQCLLNSSNITGWSLTTTAGPLPFSEASTDPGASAGYYLGQGPTSLTATPTAMTYDFGANGQFAFQTNNAFLLFGFSDIGAFLMGFPGQIVECEGSNACGGAVFQGGTTVLGDIKSVAAAPELDAASLGGALTLLLGSLAVLHGRRRSAGR